MMFDGFADEKVVWMFWLQLLKLRKSKQDYGLWGNIVASYSKSKVNSKRISIDFSEDIL